MDGPAGMQQPGSAAAGPPPGHRQYLAYFMHRHLDFRVPEIDALAELAGFGPPCWEPPPGQPLSPFWRVWLPHDAAARAIADRALLLKGFIEVWGEGATWQELCAVLRAGLPQRDAAFLQEEWSWKINVDGWGCAVDKPLDLIEQLSFLSFKGPVRLKGPDHSFRLIRATSHETGGLPTIPTRWYFGREVAMGSRSLIERYRLPERRYLGPTSMDTEMAFIIATQAQAGRGSLVYDPFVGTGSMLIAAAHFGAAVMGADIDARVIRLGKTDKNGQPVNLWTNFEDYKLPPAVGLLRADAHCMPFRAGLEEVFDAVVADPPYGVRAGARKSVNKPYVARPNGTEHFPSTAPYTLGECIQDLLDMAARTLRIGGRLVNFPPAASGLNDGLPLLARAAMSGCDFECGRLVYFLPVASELNDGLALPSTPALTVVANSEQVLSDRYSRRLITMRKVAPYDADAAAVAAAAEDSAANTLFDLDLHAHVYEPKSAVAANEDGSRRRKHRSKNV